MDYPSIIILLILGLFFGIIAIFAALIDTRKKQKKIKQAYKAVEDSTKAISKKRLTVCDFLLFISICSFVLFFLILIYKSWVWLSTGEWPELSLLPIWNVILPNTFWEWLTNDTWIGLKKILIWLLDLKATSLLLLLGFIFMILFALNLSENDISAKSD